MHGIPPFHSCCPLPPIALQRSLKGGRFEVAPFLLLEEDTSNLEEELAELPPDIRVSCKCGDRGVEGAALGEMGRLAKLPLEF